MRYTYGTGIEAADRLYELSKFFNPQATGFIRKYCHKEVNSILDIGCGPGYTTDMLAHAVGSGHVYGLDISEEFLSLAVKNYPDYTFIKHDITKFPFPASADVEYARFELSHLKNPVLLVNNWANELQRGGMLFIEEVEDIQTDIEVFNKYLEISKALVAGQGADLFVGKILAAGDYEFKVLCNESVKIPVADRQAASWFYPNTVTIWKNDDFIKTGISDHDRVQISNKILELKESDQNQGRTFWYIRRIAISKDL